ncbi:hypothetical protein DM01DRAFT_1405393 [Hesseltinella vesiculosa]|uniref:Uncharacterized protein n=1 Tax=Hesseltinella vesiculosa TaxID=101127 RepID=A0A1X2GPK6_9FUNG|nr:hypothetical protein DM01DRAFT_1405393 [Hesseltinella vesiculosa]
MSFYDGIKELSSYIRKSQEPTFGEFTMVHSANIAKWSIGFCSFEPNQLYSIWYQRFGSHIKENNKVFAKAKYDDDTWKAISQMSVSLHKAKLESQVQQAKNLRTNTAILMNNSRHDVTMNLSMYWIGKYRESPIDRQIYIQMITLCPSILEPMNPTGAIDFIQSQNGSHAKTEKMSCKGSSPSTLTRRHT